MKEKGEFGSGIIDEMKLFAAGVAALVFLASLYDPKEECSGIISCTAAVLHDQEFHMRCIISMPIATLIYFSCAIVAHTWFPRKVVAGGARPPTFSFLRWDADINVTLIGLIAGSPMIHLFHQANDKYGAASGMKMYKNPFQYGVTWAILQIPLYLLLWDFTFYVLHRWILHNPLFYKLCHSGHHAFRPPTGWSGIAVGPVDVIFEGILPYTVPLFLGIPFHEYTVNAVNALLTLHACILHSSCHAEYAQLSGWLGWLMISPIGHNMHHQYGLHNACNFAPIFKIWDRALGTLNEKEPYWWKKDRLAKEEQKLS